MRLVNKRKISNRAAAILRGNEGASIVLVTIIAILIVTGVIILRITTSALWASADKQLNQDQAYEMATSMGNSLDVLIITEKDIKLDEISQAGGIIIAKTDINELPDGTIEAKVTQDPTTYIYTVTVEAHVAHASYIYTAEYTGSGDNYKRQY